MCIFTPGSHIAQTTQLRNQQADKTRFLPRTPLPTNNQYQNSSSLDSSMPTDGNSLRRSKHPPPPPQRISSHESGVILAMQGIVVAKN